MAEDQMLDERIQLFEERAHIIKTGVETERVRVSTVVDVHETLLTESLARDVLSVERRPVDRRVDVAPQPREEGNTTIISIVEERAIVTKALFVVEELVIHRTTATDTVAIPVSVQVMRAVVEQTSNAEQSNTKEQGKI